MNPKVDLLVVGGGVLGAFHAYHAQQRGLSVALVERGAAPQGATVRNFGQVVPSGLDRRWKVFGRESLKIYQSIQSQFDISIRQLGSIYFASNEEELTLCEELHAINQQDEYESQLWTAQQCRTRYPQLREDYCRGGLFFPQEVSVNPRVMIHRLLSHLAELPGVTCNFQTCVRELASTGDGVRAATTDGRAFAADRAVVCGGAEFQLLFPELFAASDLTAVKLQMLRLEPQSAQLPGNVLTGSSIRRYESFAECPSWSEIKSREPAESFAKRWGVHILFKQEADGGVILGDSHEYFPASESREINYELRTDINEFFVSEARQIFDLSHWNVEAAWMGVYCQTSDRSGIFTKTIDGNIHIVTGIGGKGMTSSAGYSKSHLQQIYDD